MQIQLERIVFDGVGPFRREEVFDLPTEGVSYVYAPNGHGKTSSIDLVRWLIRGPAAVEQGEFRSLRQNAEKDVINHHRFRNMEGGRVQAILTVEDEGRYRVERSIAWGTEPTSELTVERDEDGTWTPIDGPHAFLTSLLPHERLGFNLLTGEHVKDFVEELSGPVVKRSVERMLQNPELVSLQERLADIVDDLEDQASAEDRVIRRRGKLKEKKAHLKEREESFRERVREKESEEHALQEKIEQLNQDLARLGDSEDLEAERDELETAIEELSPSWRTVLATGAQGAVQELLDRHETQVQAHEAWKEDMGEVRYLEKLKDRDTCYCGTEMDSAHRKRIQARIDELETGEPEVAPLPADAWTLRSWANGGRTDELAEELSTHRRRLDEIADDVRATRDRLERVDEQLEATDGEKADLIDRQLKAHKRKLHSLQDDKSKFVRSQLDAQERLNAVKEKLANTTADPVDGPLLRKARDYNEAIRETIDEALPKLRADLLDRTQAIFDRLFQKDAQFRIALSGSSMVPHVVRDVDGEEETVPLSEGEQTRLGLALLFALREVAQERPFLLLDAPFSTLDDRGVHRLLELIADHDGQLVVFTKDAFPEGRWYEAVEDADPTVFQMDWITEGPGDSEGFTQVEPADVDVLRLKRG